MSYRRAVPRSHPGLARAVNQALRRVNAELVLLSDTVARRAGLHPTDLQCVDLLLIGGPATAGTLAARVGITTGAMTAVIDRLERAGLVRRERAPGDRRCVLVRVDLSKARAIEALYAPLVRQMGRVNAGFSSEELATVLTYLGRSLDAFATHVNRLQTTARSAPVGRRRAGVRPRGGGALRRTEPPASSRA